MVVLVGKEKELAVCGALKVIVKPLEGSISFSIKPSSLYRRVTWSVPSTEITTVVPQVSVQKSDTKVSSTLIVTCRACCASAGAATSRPSSAMSATSAVRGMSLFPLALAAIKAIAPPCLNIYDRSRPRCSPSLRRNCLTTRRVVVGVKGSAYPTTGCALAAVELGELHGDLARGRDVELLHQVEDQLRPVRAGGLDVQREPEPL